MVVMLMTTTIMVIPIDVTVAGIVTDTRFVHALKAPAAKGNEVDDGNRQRGGCRYDDIDSDLYSMMCYLLW